ncbi:MAG: hypothetical protein U0132_04355 [Gemmatimonadaceae bacterium]
MADDAQTREDDLRQLLTDAIEVQLAALKAGISFWTDWIQQTSDFVQSATKTLANINSSDQGTKDSLLELVDAGRASLRAFTDLPRTTATRFIDELDKLHAQDNTAKSGTASKKSSAAPSPKKASARPRPGRAGRAKA